MLGERAREKEKKKKKKKKKREGALSCIIHSLLHYKTARKIAADILNYIFIKRSIRNKNDFTSALINCFVSIPNQKRIFFDDCWFDFEESELNVRIFILQLKNPLYNASKTTNIGEWVKVRRVWFIWYFGSRLSWSKNYKNK